MFHKKWKQYNEIQLTKNKMDLNIRKMTNHTPSPVCEKRASIFKKFQTAVSTTKRYFTLLVACLIIECTRRHRKGN